MATNISQNTPPAPPPLPMDEYERLKREAEMIRFRREIQEENRRKLEEDSQKKRSDQIREAQREYMRNRLREIAACNHRWERGESAIRGQYDAEGNVIGVCQRCQEVKYNLNEIKEDPKWMGSGIDLSSWGGPNRA